MWSWHPDAGVKLAGDDLQATVAKEPGHRGEHAISVKTIAQGNAGLLRCTCSDYARVVFSFPREAAGAQNTRLSLRPLFFRGTSFSKTRADRAAGAWMLVSIGDGFEHPALG